MSTPQPPLTVFYDGSCIVCSREIAHYQRMEVGDRLLFVDIAAPAFDPSLYGRTKDEFMAQIHVRDAEGRFHTGVDAFAGIWAAVPGEAYTLLSRLVQLPGIHMLATFGYHLFARFRKYLPKRESCDSGTCHLGHSKNQDR